MTWSGVLRYLLTTPLMVAFWMFVLLALLTAAARDRSGEQIVVATSAVIGGARLLAHVHEEIAHELAKAVPIAILGFILIGGGFTGSTRRPQLSNRYPWTWSTRIGSAWSCSTSSSPHCGSVLSGWPGGVGTVG